MDNGQFTGILDTQLFCELLLQEFHGDGDCAVFRFILNCISCRLIKFILLRTQEGNVIDELTIRFTDLCHDKLCVIRDRCSIREDRRYLNTIRCRCVTDTLALFLHPVPLIDDTDAEKGCHIK